MKLQPTDSRESWAEKVQAEEYQWACRRIAAGDPVLVVMELMSVRIVKKLLYFDIQQQKLFDSHEKMHYN